MNPKSKHYSTIAFGLAAVGVVLFSAKAIMVKMAYGYDIDTLSLLLIRMGIALPFYIIIALFESRRKTNMKLMPKDYLFLTILGFLGYYMASYLDFKGLNYITASIERLILFVYPTLVIIISAIFLKKPVSLQQKLAVGVTYIGVFVAFYKYSAYAAISSNIPLGTVLVFGSALTYAVYLVGSGDMIPRIGSVRFTSYAMIVSCIAVMLHYFIKNDGNVLDQQTEVYFLGLGMAFISTIIPSFMLAEAIKRIGASNVAIVGSIGPISTIILATIFLGEKIGIYQIIGTVIVISGVLLIALSKKKVKIS
ncbi:MAG: DMT family transporter [Salinivirgaceae bacterium]|jgi:drug/metabolite transporter (DMT)-like permease|nr:DMT family transporter [Salinivirgaceae bacterium]